MRKPKKKKLKKYKPQKKNTKRTHKNIRRKKKRVISRMCFCRSLIIQKKNKKQNKEIQMINAKCEMENQRKAEKQNM